MLTFNNVVLLSGDDHWINYGTDDYYRITYICNGGTVSGPDMAMPGEVVSFSTSIGSDWLIDYTVIDGNESSSNSFTMPAHDVIVYVFCKLDTDVDTVRFLFLEDNYDPTVSVPEEGWQGTWQRVSSSPNVWDYFCNRGGYWEFASSAEGGRLRGAPDFEILGNNFDHINRWGKFFGGATHLVKVHYMALHQDPNYNGNNAMFADCASLTEAYLGCDESVRFLGDNTAGMFGNCPSLQTVGFVNTDKVVDVGCMFDRCSNLTVAPSFDTSSVTSMVNMFQACSSLVEVPQYNTANVTTMYSMFERCNALEELPQFNTHNVINFEDFMWCPYGSSLKHVPLFDTTSATTVKNMFSACRNVESGALALYTQMANQTVPPATHSGAFRSCGSNTTTGAAELAQIPSDWK